MRAHRKTDFTDIYQTSSTPHIKNLPWYGVSAYGPTDCTQDAVAAMLMVRHDRNPRTCQSLT